MIDSRSACQRTLGPSLDRTRFHHAVASSLSPTGFENSSHYSPPHASSLGYNDRHLPCGRMREPALEGLKLTEHNRLKGSSARNHPATRSKAAPNRARNMAQKNQVMQGPSSQPRPDHNNWRRSYHASETPIRNKAWPCRRGCSHPKTPSCCTTACEQRPFGDNEIPNYASFAS